MAWHPQQLHFLKAPQRTLGVGDQWQQAGDDGALAAGDLANSDAAVASQQKSARTCQAGQKQCGMQGTQLGLVVATTDAGGCRALAKLTLR